MTSCLWLLLMTVLHVQVFYQNSFAKEHQVGVFTSTKLFEVLADDIALSPIEDTNPSYISEAAKRLIIPTSERERSDQPDENTAPNYNSIQLCNPGEFTDNVEDDDIDLFAYEDEENCLPCIRVEEIVPKLLIGEDDVVKIIGLNSTVAERTVANKTNIKAYSVDYHYKRNFVFFVANNMIIRAKLVGVGLVSSCRVLPVNLTGPTTLAVDWVHDKLYWMTDNRHRVEVSDLDGSNRTSIFIGQINTRYPKNFVIDPYAGFLFLVNENSIFRADLNGSNYGKLSLPSSWAGNISRIAIDRHKNKLYFFGLKAVSESYVAFCDYNGGHKKMVLKPDRYHWDDVLSMDVFRERLIMATFYRDYWNRIEVLDSNGMRVNGYATDDDKIQWAVKVLHPNVQQRDDRRQCPVLPP